MIKNYFKIAIRNLIHHRKHALLNIGGLSVALAACIIVFLVIQFESSFNHHIQARNNIYQIQTKQVNGDGENLSCGTPFPVMEFFRKDYPQHLFGQAMMYNGSQITVKENDGSIGKKFIEPIGVMYADAELMKIFEVKFITGTAAVLSQPMSAAISKSIAEKYFGNVQSAIGKRLNIDLSDNDVQVSAVFEDAPENSDLRFKVVASYASFIAQKGNGWPITDWGSNTSSHQTFVKVNTAASTNTLNMQLADFDKKYNKNNPDAKRTYYLESLSALHFNEKIGGNGEYNISKKSLYTLAFIGLLVILMACINFINLSTALAVTRSKEIGIRKVMGSTQNQLRWQVFTETAFVVTVASLIALLIAALALPYVKDFMVVQSRLQLFNTGSILFILVIIIGTILLSGFYPALILGRLQPVQAIKNKVSTSRLGNISLRRVLVVLQFAFSQIFIIATIIAISQMKYIDKVDLGFNKEAVIVLTGSSDSISLSRLASFKEALKARADVKGVSFANDAVSSQNSWQTNFAFDIMKDKEFDLSLKFSDEDYDKVFGLQLLAGRYLSASDTLKEFVVNETFLKKCGLKNPADAIGKMLRIGGRRPMPVVGVVKDFKNSTLKDAIPPIAISSRKRFYQQICVKLSTVSLVKSNKEIETLWNKFYPEYVYNSAFLDDNIKNYYLQEQRTSSMYKIYAGLAIFISCLGLYGLISFMAVQKTKEVGIRKVLGASVQSIMYLFSKEFTVLILIAFVIAAPVAWYLMHKWLEDFLYRTEINIWVFLAAILSSLMIAWITVGYKAFKAAIVNPVKSLRTE